MAMEWRDIIRAVHSRFQQSPGGAPPWELMEGMVQAQSGGDPKAMDRGSQGLALIHPGSRMYAEYTKQYGREPDLWNPADNVGVMALELDRIQEAGMTDAEGGGPGATQDWMVAALAFKGWADETGLTFGRGKRGADEDAEAAYAWDGEVREYIISNFGRERIPEIDALHPGAVRRDQGKLEYVPNDLQPPEGINWPKPSLPSIGNPVGQAVGFIQNVAGRVALFLAGLAVVALGIWAVR